MKIKINDKMFLKDDLAAKKLSQKVSLSIPISQSSIKRGYMTEAAIFECQDDSVNEGKPYYTAVITIASDVKPTDDIIERETIHTSSGAFISDLRFIKEILDDEMKLSDEPLTPYVTIHTIPSKKYAGKNLYRLCLE